MPVLMGYSVLGFAFGLLMRSQGYAWYLPVAMSVVIYAGALQFLALEFFRAKAGMWEIFVASIFVNIRQAFYGLSLLKKFKKSGLFRPYLIFALTDETYALMTTLKVDPGIDPKRYLFYLAALNQSYWVLGTLAGSLVGGMVHFDTRGLDFSLTALFVVLAMEQYAQRKRLSPFLIGAGASILALMSVSRDRMLIAAIALALVGMFALRSALDKGEERDDAERE
jgi:4-azaleucine resistance transporter AzlC